MAAEGPLETLLCIALQCYDCVFALKLVGVPLNARIIANTIDRGNNNLVIDLIKMLQSYQGCCSFIL